MRVAQDQVLAFRVAGQRLAERTGSMLEAAAGWGLQDSPPGSAALALHARVEELAPEALAHAVEEERALLQTYNPRTATCVVPAAEAATFLGGLVPPDEAAWEDQLASALPDRVLPASEAVERTLEAVRSVLDGRSLSRDELHAELRERLPLELLPWCAGCGSHHARRGLLVACALRGALCIPGRRGRQPAFARTDQWLGATVESADPDSAAAEVVRRYLRGYGPSTPLHFSEWAGLSRSHALRSWSLVEGELTEVEHDGARGSWVLAADASRLAAPPPAHGLRLLPPGDPFLLARDRELLFSEKAVRQRVWRAIGSPGVVLADGRPTALWRSRKQGRRLELTVEPLARLSAGERAAVEVEAVGVAPHRGRSSVEVRFAEVA